MQQLIGFLAQNHIWFEENIPLSKKTWIKTGGLCACWIVPDSVHQLTELCKYLYVKGLKFDIVGQTSNIFFHSTYNPEIVVSTVKINNYYVEGNIITCDCGVNVAKLSRECLEAGYAGFCGLVGLPGTVAASVYGNAGCFDCSIVAMLINVDVLLPDGTIRTYEKEDLGYAFRTSAFKRGDINGIILTSRLKVVKADDIEIEKRKAEDSNNYRKNKQEKPSWCLGSVFSVRKQRWGGRFVMAKLLSIISGILHVESPRKVLKKALLFLYGYKELNPYVSDKNVNTFIWRDNNAERMFVSYKEFMSKVYVNPVLEIEERE